MARIVSSRFASTIVTLSARASVDDGLPWTCVPVLVGVESFAVGHSADSLAITAPPTRLAHPPVTEEVVVLQSRADDSLPLQKEPFFLSLFSADRCGLGLRAVVHIRDHAVIPHLDGDPVGDLDALQETTAHAPITASTVLNAHGPIVRRSRNARATRRAAQCR